MGLEGGSVRCRVGVDDGFRCGGRVVTGGESVDWKWALLFGFNKGEGLQCVSGGGVLGGRIFIGSGRVTVEGRWVALGGVRAWRFLGSGERR